MTSPTHDLAYRIFNALWMFLGGLALVLWITADGMGNQFRLPGDEPGVSAETVALLAVVALVAAIGFAILALVTRKAIQDMQDRAAVEAHSTGGQDDLEERSPEWVAVNKVNAEGGSGATRG